MLKQNNIDANQEEQSVEKIPGGDGIELQNIKAEIQQKDEEVLKKNMKFHAIYTSCQYAKPQPILFKEQAIVSSLILQKLMYFNSYYSFIHGYFLLFSVFYKFKVIDNVTGEIIHLVLILVWIFFETFRLNNGYSGNINETFPEFVSFILLTIANIGICIGYIIVGRQVIGILFSIELVIQILEILFLVFEIIACFCSIGSIIKAQLLNRKSKKKKERAIVIEQSFMLEDEQADDVDENNPYARQHDNNDNQNNGNSYPPNNHQEDGFPRRRNQPHFIDGDDFDNMNENNENIDPQIASNAPYSRNYNASQVRNQY